MKNNGDFSFIRICWMRLLTASFLRKFLASNSGSVSMTTMPWLILVSIMLPERLQTNMSKSLYSSILKMTPIRLSMVVLKILTVPSSRCSFLSQAAFGSHKYPHSLAPFGLVTLTLTIMAPIPPIFDTPPPTPVTEALWRKEEPVLILTQSFLLVVAVIALSESIPTATSNGPPVPVLPE